MAFPDLAPEDAGQEHTEGNSTWKWDGVKWQKQFNITANSSTSLIDIEGEIGNALTGHDKILIPDYTSLESQKDTNEWVANTFKNFDNKYTTGEKFIGGITYGGIEPNFKGEGTLWYKTEPAEEQGLYVYDGFDWYPASTYEAPPAVVLRDSAPDLDYHREGTIWIDENTFDSFVAVTADDSTKGWVQLNSDAPATPSPLTMSDTPPDLTSKDDGQLWVNTNNMDLFVLFDGEWIKINASLA